MWKCVQCKIIYKIKSGREFKCQAIGDYLNKLAQSVLERYLKIMKYLHTGNIKWKIK